MKGLRFITPGPRQLRKLGYRVQLFNYYSRLLSEVSPVLTALGYKRPNCLVLRFWREQDITGILIRGSIPKSRDFFVWYFNTV